MEIRNKTVYDRKLIIEFNRQYTIQYLKKFFVPFAIVDIGISIYYAVIDDWQSVILFLGIMASYFALATLLPIITTLIRLRNNTLSTNPISFFFLLNETSVVVKNKDKSRTISYESISKAILLHGFVSLVDEFKNTYVIDLTTFDNLSDIQNIKLLLRRKLGKRLK